MDNLTNSVHSAKGALRALQLSERKDKLMVYISVGFFALVVLYILFRRLGIIRLVTAIVSGLAGLGGGQEGDDKYATTAHHAGHDEL
jgi:hypothetical protein